MQFKDKRQQSYDAIDKLMSDRHVAIKQACLRQVNKCLLVNEIPAIMLDDRNNEFLARFHCEIITDYAHMARLWITAYNEDVQALACYEQVVRILSAFDSEVMKDTVSQLNGYMGVIRGHLC